ncbi:LytR/AlgR family response regulator transcription factor [Chitinophaga rhizophila]|uniref:LytTR family DNA-binding domain-containing protein n=1 Tax=Chitinophaga rhizophila TaxID=2866212 RepID=A0ABS7G9D2_9BACT|nr:LytTR family DNA-binding domain-containing protein [Chitinophaga rhizophila]MBW8683128.1 LytTR family DNA-binding domain-containing protein [Chitinophaga rhizophila]
MRILIIENEINTAKELERILVDLDASNVVMAVLDSIEDSVKFLSGNDLPDLIFSDIQLADGVCFDIFREVNIKAPIIFCTSYDEYMLDAFKTNAVSYLLKPITKDSVKTAMEKYQSLKSVFESATATLTIEKISQQFKNNYKKSILVEQRESIIPLPVNDIAYIYLENTIVQIGTTKNHQYFIASTLDELERMLDPEVFYRANRQFIINKLSIVNVEKIFPRKLLAKLTVKTPESIVISKANASAFLRWLEGC